MFRKNGVIVNTGDGEDSIRLDWHNGKRVLNHYVQGKLEKRIDVPSHMTGLQAKQLAEAELFLKKNKRK